MSTLKLTNSRIPLLVILALATILAAKSQSIRSFPEDKGFQTSLIKPKNITKISDNHYFIDFGKDAFGTLVLSIKTDLTDTLIVHLGEKAAGSGGIDHKPGGTIRYQRITLPVEPSTSKYTLQLLPDKRNTNPPAVALPDSFGVIMPFRYCEIENLRIPLSKKMIRQKVYQYHFDETSSAFTCSDTILNQIWDLCKHTIKATSFCRLYIDGDRERIPYEADALINQLSHYSVDNEYSIARKTNEYFINHPTWPTEWILQTAFLFYYDFLYTGNIISLAKNYEALKYKSLIDLEREDGLISTKSEKLTDELMGKIGFLDTRQRIRDNVDWPEGERDGYDMAGINTVMNSFYYRNLTLMAELAGYLGKKVDSVNFYNKAAVVKNTINRKLFDKNKGIYIDGENSQHSSLHANLFPLAFGLVPDEFRSSVISFIKTKGMACSVYGAQHLLDGLYAAGEADYALDLMVATDDRSWWNMIRSGSTITLEAWDMKYKPNADWNHAWGAAPANIITRRLWGITPAEPGFAKALINPQLSNLEFSRIKVPTIRGPIFAEYKQVKKKGKRYLIDLPAEIKADFVFPCDGHTVVLLNGNRINNSKGLLNLIPGRNRIEIR